MKSKTAQIVEQMNYNSVVEELIDDGYSLQDAQRMAKETLEKWNREDEERRKRCE